MRDYNDRPIADVLADTNAALRDVRQPIGMSLREVCESLTPAEREAIVLAYEPLALCPMTRGAPIDAETAFWTIFAADKRIAAFQNRVFSVYWNRKE